MVKAEGATIESLMRAIEANPLDLALYGRLAELFRADHDLPRAEMTLRRAIEIDPADAQAWRQLGIVCADRNDWRSSADAFEVVCADGSAGESDWVGLGMASIAEQDLARAERVRDELMGRFPGSAKTWLFAGHLEKLLGRIDEAAARYRQALEIDPGETDAFFNLVDVAPPAIEDPVTRRLQSLRAATDLSTRDAANVGFSLARIYEQAGLAAETMSALADANAAAAALMQASGNAYDPRRYEGETDWLHDFFGANEPALREACPPLEIGIKPLFVVGMPRSGTTLVERILTRLPGVASGGELPGMQHGLASLRQATVAHARKSGTRFEGEPLKQLLGRLRRQYLDALLERDLDGDTVVDKLPANFTAIGLIRLLFPDARIVHCARDPVATCFSLYAAYFGIHLSYDTSFGNLVHYYNRVYVRSMALWQRLHGEHIVTVRYEDLVSDPDARIRELLDRCRLPWDVACLRPHENERAVFTANMRQARRPIHAESVQRWRRFEAQLRPLVEGLQPRPTY